MNTQQVAEELKRLIELHAGAVFTGPDAGQLSYTFDGQMIYKLNYLAVAQGGFATSDILLHEMQRFAMAREFIILGNPVRLQKVWNTAGVSPPITEGIPQGPILVWRREPAVTFEDDVWSAAMTYAVLPPYARIAE